MPIVFPVHPRTAQKLNGEAKHPNLRLTDQQVATLRALYAGPVNAAGESVYPGLMPGGESQWQPLVGGG
jgi:hypothetical protein